MARRIVVNFDASNQSLLASNIVTAGAVDTVPLANAYPFVFPNIARVVSFHSTADISGVTFTIVGTDQYGGEQAENVVGPTAGETVYTIGFYHTVENIIADGAIVNLSIGSGPTGMSQWIPVDNFSVEGSLNLQINTSDPITYSVKQTNDVLESYQNSGASYKYVVNTEVTAFAVDATLTAQTVNRLFKVEIPSAAYQISITLSSADGSLSFIILQQGIR